LAPAADTDDRAETGRMKNVMSVDLEDWFCVYNLSAHIPYADWDKCESRVERSTERLLDAFRRHSVEATSSCWGGWRTVSRGS
jgi:hypothetical protein